MSRRVVVIVAVMTALGVGLSLWIDGSEEVVPHYADPPLVRAEVSVVEGGDAVLWRQAVEAPSLPTPPTVAAAEVPKPVRTSPRSWWEERQRELPPNVIEALVVRDRAPVVGAHVRLWLDAKDFAAVARGDMPCSRDAVTDVDGLVRFEGASSRRAVLRADDRGEHVIEAAADDTRAGDWTTVLTLGSASIQGKVCDLAGHPMPGARICVRAFEPKPTGQCRVEADARGEFLVTGLAAGRFSVEWQDETIDLWERQCMAVLSVGGRALVRFGAVPGSVLWTGRVVDSYGEVVGGARAVRFVERTHNEDRYVFADAQGSFAVQLSPGMWDAHVVWSRFDPLPTEACGFAVLGVCDHVGDVVLPGLRVLCHLRGRTPNTNLWMAEMFRFESGGHRVLTRPPFRVDGETYVQWVGLEPGQCVLRSEGLLIVGEPEGGIRLELTGGAPVHRLELTLEHR